MNGYMHNKFIIIWLKILMNFSGAPALKCGRILGNENVIVVNRSFYYRMSKLKMMDEVTLLIILPYFNAGKPM